MPGMKSIRMVSKRSQYLICDRTRKRDLTIIYKEETVSLKLRSGEKSARSEFFSRKTPGKTKIEKN